MIQNLMLFSRRAQARDLSFRPNTDVFRRGNDLIIRIEMPGLREEDYRITASSDSIEVNGVRVDYACKDGFYQMEIPFGEFRTTVDIPAEIRIDGSRVSAWYDQGFLYIRCPRMSSRKIRIETGSA